ncbi:MAG: RNA polymerase sigma factor [Acidobacteria bacterium]|nr:RNA polymerase sigma factor [Acidobacteriota bacterium]
MNVRQRTEEIYREAREDVYHYLLTFNLPQEEAQDTTQEAFLRLHAALTSGELIRNPRAWVFRVAHNMAVNTRVREKVRGEFEESETADQSASAEQRMLKGEQITKMREGLRSLSEQQRRSLYLRAEGLRYQEIAGIMGVSLSTVAEYVGRAVLRLRKTIHG